jgi:hypothetical protein
MTETEQVEFLLSLGDRLDNWTSPGDENDRLLGDTPLWSKEAKKCIQWPARVWELLAARWIHIKNFGNQTDCRFIFNPAQRYFDRVRTDKNIILKAGRAGFTTYLWARGLIKSLTQQGHTSLLVAHRDKPAQSYFMEAHRAIDTLPGDFAKVFRSGALRTTGPGAKKNVGEIYFPVLNSRFFVVTAGERVPAEGETFQYLIADEFAHWTGDPSQSITTLLSHITGDATEAYLLSRPSGQSGEFYERYWAARRGESDYSSHFFQWWWNRFQRKCVPQGFVRTEEERQVAARYRQWRIDSASKDCGLPFELDDEQIAWRRAAKRELQDKFVEKFAEDEATCFLGSGNCPFSAEAIAAILNDATPVLERQGGAGESENGLLVWELPNPGSWYVLFCDPAGALHTSRIAMQLINGSTGNQAAEWVGRSDAGTAAAIASDIARRYGRTIIVFESNLGEVSATFCGKLTAAPNNFSESTWPKLWQHKDSGGQWQYGWKTDGQNRPEMVDSFGQLLRDAPHVFHSKRLANELKACVRDGDKIKAGKGMTDDLMMAMAGAHKVRLMESGVAREPIVEAVFVSQREIQERSWNNI